MKALITFVAMLPLCLYAQVVRQPLSVRYAGLGAYSKNFTDVFSGTANQAAFARLKTGGFGAYGERRFMLEELNQFSAVLAVPTASGTIAVQGDYFGSGAFNENQLGLAYARAVSSQVDLGIKFNYHTLHLPGYGNSSALNFEVGTIFHLTDQLHAGFHIYNPFSSKIGKTGEEKLASIYKTGLGYEASDHLFVSAEFVKQEDQPATVNVGLQYNIQQRVFLRAGLSTLTSNSFAGVGLTFGQMRLDLNAAYHPQLGFTPGILILFNFKKEDKQ